MNYTPNIRKSSQTFVSVLQKAKDWFASLCLYRNILDWRFKPSNGEICLYIGRGTIV